MASSGPSRLQGNLLGRFRGGLGLERGPAYPTPAEHPETEEERAAYLDAALEDKDPVLVAAALEDGARAR